MKEYVCLRGVGFADSYFTYSCPAEEKCYCDVYRRC